MDLVIVESPTKAKTLSKFLGSKYKVVASYGHVRDLPKSQLGVDVEHDFKPEYAVPIKAKALVKSLKEAALGAKEIWLSTDPDREGEAIAFHLAQVLAPKNSKFEIRNSKLFRRAVFHEITESAVEDAFAHPRSLDENLINSQQARRILDRLVGYKLSPLLWRKVAGHLSAGRVQSVAVRLIVERERERLAFKSQEYWTITVVLSSDAGKLRESNPRHSGGQASTPGVEEASKATFFEAQLWEKDNRKIEIVNEAEAKKIELDLRASQFKVSEVKSEEKKRYPGAPFTTSSLQQTAGNKLGLTAERTMRAAQGLYEKGLITYMRTDSVNLSQEFLSKAAAFIRREFGDAYAPAAPLQYKTKSRLAQEAHEAIRPTNLELRSKNQELSGDEAKVYSLIYSRALSSQMVPAVFDATMVNILTRRVEGENPPGSKYLLRASGSVIKFDGWLRVGQVQSSKFKVQSEESEAIGEEAENQNRLPSLQVDQALNLEDLQSIQHFTQPPGRFSEASLVKALEENGIGRPSTYAPTIGTIQRRGYVAKEGRYLFPKDVGFVVNDLLVKHFPQIVDVGFTAKLEEQFDEIAQGKLVWPQVIREFYEPFAKLLAIKEKEIKKGDVTTIKETDEKCPECGKPLVVKLGRYGSFLSCKGFPDCKYARPFESQTPGVNGQDSGSHPPVDQEQLKSKCPQDEGELVLKQGRFGQFIACKNYPKCKFTKPYLEKIGLKCPTCREGDVVVKKSKFKKIFYGCSRYPDCKFASWRKPESGGQEDPSDKVTG